MLRSFLELPCVLLVLALAGLTGCSYLWMTFCGWSRLPEPRGVEFLDTGVDKWSCLVYGDERTGVLAVIGRT